MHDSVLSCPGCPGVTDADGGLCRRCVVGLDYRVADACHRCRLCLAAILPPELIGVTPTAVVCHDCTRRVRSTPALAGRTYGA